MAAAAGNDWDAAFGPLKSGDNRTRLRRAFRLLFDAGWDGGGLEFRNVFTRTLVGRCAGKCVEAGQGTPGDFLSLKQTKLDKGDQPQTLEELLRETVRRIPESLQVQGYPPSPVLAYWLLDAIDLLGVRPPAPDRRKLVEWTTRTFTQEFAVLAAKHVGLMDPVALAFTACTAQRLRKLMHSKQFDRGDGVLPSDTEVTAAISAVLLEQSPAGIWPKYFPLFHYPNAGANYCFAVELLEAVIDAFSNHRILTSSPFLEAVERTVGWCEENRILGVRNGWNSGGRRAELLSSIPEAWATAAVYLFLHKGHEYVSNLLQAEVMARYTRKHDPSARSWDALLDTQIHLQGEQNAVTLKSILLEEIVTPAATSERPGRRRSVLLFGPPGTSKTSYVRAVAQRLGWPLVEITPADFLRDGLSGIYARAAEIFEDLDDLRNVVAFFDEMEALVQSRDPAEADITARFLTTAMLPKVAEMHSGRRLIVFVATNHQEQVDAAVKRPGRFDLQLCVGPPSWSERVERLHHLIGEPKEPRRQSAVRSRLTVLSRGSEASLDRFTVDETRALLEEVKRRQNTSDLLEALRALTPSSFGELVRKWSDEYVTLRRRLAGGAANPVATEYETDVTQSRRQ